MVFIPTPLGNLLDITLRSLEELKKAEVLLCEDTRVSKKLLGHLVAQGLLPPREYKFIALHSHNEEELIHSLGMDFFKQKVAVLCDAGMPTVSDPGSFLLRFLMKHNVEFEVLPGACALMLGIVSSGFLQKEFSFFGFLPHKVKECEAVWIEALNSKYPVVFYQSPHRLIQSLEILEKLEANREICVLKELTKLHQSRYYGSVQEVLQTLKQTEIRGEWVLVLSAREKQKESEKKLGWSEIWGADIPPKAKAKLLAHISSKSVNECYNLVIEANG